MPAVSVILPTYNCSFVLDSAIKSVLNQTFTDYELLVVGDHCTDDSEAHVKSFKDSRIRWINLPKRVGIQSGPNNEAGRQAKGKYITHLAHDDLWLPWHLSSLVTLLEKGADFVATLAAFIHPNERVEAYRPNPFKKYQMGKPGLWGYQKALLKSSGPWEIERRRLFTHCDREFGQRLIEQAHDIVLSDAVTLISFPAASWMLYKNRELPQKQYFEKLVKDPEKLLLHLLKKIALEDASWYENKKQFRGIFLDILIDSLGPDRLPARLLMKLRHEAGKKINLSVRGFCENTPHPFRKIWRYMIEAFQAEKKGSRLTPTQYAPRPLGPFDIQVAITHCGICHSDLHLIDNDWSFTEYPLIPGHEIVGKIAKKGERVDTLNLGDRVGIGWQGYSCMHCEWCLQGDENLCLDQEGTCVGHQGGFAKQIVADGRFAFPLPENIPSREAAPLLCGGVTVFAPFLEYEIGPTMKVAVVGIGGLGHMAIQFAHAMGCEVTALSTSADKEEEAKKLGADHFVPIKGSESLEALANRFDFILSSSSSGLDWPRYIAMLRPRGKLCLLGGLEKQLEIPVGTLVDGRKRVCGSNIGSRPIIKKMLAFAAQHNIRPQIEVFPMAQVNEAIEKLRKGQVRYRVVLEN